MPIYEYRCPSCNSVFEQLRPMSKASDPVPCPDCQTASPRMISRLARVSSGEGDDHGDEGFGGGDDDFYTGGHSHDAGHSH